jgi:beta-carotene 3-hydroxylase
MNWEALAIIIVTILGMEVFATLVHKHVMHGPLGWRWHRDHHEPHDGVFETNDLYAVVFSLLVIAAMLLGSLVVPWLFWVGVGATVYGFLYFVVHDGLVHKRWPFRYVPRRGYLRRLYQAHRLHHATQGREGGVSFGFLYAPAIQRLKQELAAQSGRDQRNTAREG